MGSIFGYYILYLKRPPFPFSTQLTFFSFLFLCIIMPGTSVRHHKGNFVIGKSPLIVNYRYPYSMYIHKSTSKVRVFVQLQSTLIIRGFFSIRSHGIDYAYNYGYPPSVTLSSLDKIWLCGNDTCIPYRYHKPKGGM